MIFRSSFIRTSTATALAVSILAGSLSPALAASPTGPVEGSSQTKPTDTDTSGIGAATLTEEAQKITAPKTARVEPESDRVIVKFKDNIDTAKKEQTLDKVADQSPVDAPQIIKQTVSNADVVKVKDNLDKSKQTEVVQKIQDQPDVEWAEIDHKIIGATASYPSTPNDPLYGSAQWNLRNIDVPGAWQESTGSGTTIGIVDSGITNHPDLDGKRVPDAADFVHGEYDRDGTPGRDLDPTDPGVLAASENWHGTHVAGIAGASTNNGIGVAGVAPDAKIEPVRAFGIGGSGWESDFADGITYAAGGTVSGMPANRNPSSVVNFSGAWDGQCSRVMKDAIDGAHARNVPVVVAAGNAGVNANNVQPANCLGAVVVGASAISNVMTGYSNYGPMLDVLAPGGAVGGPITSTYNTGFYSPGAPTYGTLNGTSMAAPHVAGVIALMKSKNPNLTVEQIRSILVSTGDNISGYKKVNARAAVAATPSSIRVVNGIGAFYRAHGGANAFGNPLYNERSGLVNGGVYQGFSKNSTIYWSPASGTHSVNFNGGIGLTYRAGGYENRYGYPVSEETYSNGVAYQWFKKANGQLNLFMWTPSTGTHIINESGGIGNHWANTGRENGAGVPAYGETYSNGVAYQGFTKWGHMTTIIWTTRTGAHSVYEDGAIASAWSQSGRESGSWGFPVTDEYRTGDGKIHQRFSGGVEAIWSPTSFQVIKR